MAHAQHEQHHTNSTKTLTKPTVIEEAEISDDVILISQGEEQHPKLLSVILTLLVTILNNEISISCSGQDGQRTVPVNPEPSLLDYHRGLGFQDAYKMTSSPRGRCLIINNRDFTNTKLQKRLGTDADRDKLKKLFQYLDYQVTVKENCTADDIASICQMFILGDFERFDSCVLCILSHGCKGKIYGTDGKLVRENEILGLFNSPQCKLKGKPKLVFIQACRVTLKRSVLEKLCLKGNAVDTEDEGPAKQDVSEMIQDLRKLVFEDENDKAKLQAAAPIDDTDILVAYSTLPDRFSYRNLAEGSWFIYAIVKVFEQQCKAEHVADMMKTVKRVVREASNDIQTPHIYDQLEKKFYFFPIN